MAPDRFPGCQRLGYPAGGDSPAIDRRYYELCVLSELRDNLRSGDISVAGSRQYKDFEEYLMPRPRYVELKAAGELPVSVPVNFDRYISECRELLHERLEEVGEQLSEGQLTDVRLRRGLISITPLKSIEPPEAESIKRLISQTLPRIKITDLLVEVDQLTGFSREFVDMRTGVAAPQKELLLAAILDGPGACPRGDLLPRPFANHRLPSRRSVCTALGRRCRLIL